MTIETAAGTARRAAPVFSARPTAAVLGVFPSARRALIAGLMLCAGPLFAGCAEAPELGIDAATPLADRLSSVPVAVTPALSVGPALEHLRAAYAAAAAPGEAVLRVPARMVVEAIAFDAAPAQTVAISVNVYFDLSSAAPDADAEAAVDGAFAAVLRQSRRGRMVTIAIDGHADRSGDADANRRLSYGRANAVRRLLSDRLRRAARAGAEIPHQFVLRALGESRPATPTRDGVAEARNRRVEITVTAPAETGPGSIATAR